MKHVVAEHQIEVGTIKLPGASFRQARLQEATALDSRQ